MTAGPTEKGGRVRDLGVQWLAHSGRMRNKQIRNIKNKIDNFVREGEHPSDSSKMRFEREAEAEAGGTRSIPTPRKLAAVRARSRFE